jgi:DNA-binding Lrp family transcriptional regulator
MALDVGCGEPRTVAGNTEDAALARVVTRLSGQYLLRYLQLIAHEGDIRDAIVGIAIVAANTAHLDGPTGEGWRYAGVAAPPPDEARQPVSISRVAESLGLPFETARRRVGRLIRAGGCVKVPGGVIIPTAVLTRRAPSRALTNAGYVRAFVRDLEAAGQAEAAAFTAAWPSDAAGGDVAIARVVTRLSAGYALRAFRLLVDVYGDVRSGIVAQAIVTANTAHLVDREGSRYAGVEETPPDAVRRPVSVLSLAGALGLPYETLRAQVQRLIEAGVCVRVDGGVLVPAAVLETPVATRATMANVAYVRQFLRDLLARSLEALALQPDPAGEARA